MLKVITKYQIELRNFWVNEISLLSGNFGDDAEKLEHEIREEIQRYGLDSLLGHLRLCSAIPEWFRHDSSEEKLYSKYTDIVIHEAYLWMGLTSKVLKERGNVADVECVTDEYSFVADAKAFRMSRTAKNQKDFKVQAMDDWKHGHPYAMIVSPFYQLPARRSQIYSQAGARSVALLTYSHLAVFAKYASMKNRKKARSLLYKLYQTIDAMNPTYNANTYWQIVNGTMLEYDSNIRELWLEEKIASLESIDILKEEALHYLDSIRNNILQLSREEAIQELLRISKIDNKKSAVQSVSDNGILSMVGSL